MIYELREYVAHEGAEQKVHDRFADDTLPLFERHGLDVIGFWQDREDPTRILYLLRFDDLDTQQLAWSRFQNDPDWKQAKASSEADGPIVAEMTSRILNPVSYWPATDGPKERA
ncbi:NIPSNAP family protein [Aeromicrobium sp. YIM 150415]|uniref:NIPSNAP family protein n=1 Tax=Aeromicrobium sp. YIM 150415 TaxID=2803912 RepID=UPI0019664A0D|nr:NIPSNAP family protein [Aeromicrobium sp. YIM 150415]MBM9462838.1 NIPSNAP family protein [Aeromicrobium sp. YIM 150415]